MLIEGKSLKGKIHVIRSIRIILDFDLDELYGVKTRVLKQTVCRNIDRFPDGFMFEISKEEYHFLKSQFVILENEGRAKYSEYRSFAFTKQVKNVYTYQS